MRAPKRIYVSNPIHVTCWYGRRREPSDLCYILSPKPTKRKTKGGKR